MTKPRRLPSNTSQKEAVRVYADADPTGETIKFGVVSGISETTKPTTWVAGAWDTWTAADGAATALTPRIGSAAASPAAEIAVTAGNYRLWIQITTTGEQVVIDLGLLEVF